MPKNRSKNMYIQYKTRKLMAEFEYSVSKIHAEGNFVKKIEFPKR